jgi:tetratricopeptide (TPR) repeat protein
MYWIIMGNYGYTSSELAYDEAERLSLKVIEIDGDLYEAHWSLGWAQFVGEYAWQGVLGRYDEAMTAARIALDLDPLAYWSRRGLSFLHIRQRQYGEAIHDSLELTARIGWTPFLRANMAWLLAKANRHDEAQKYLLEAEAANTEDVNVHLFLAIVYGKLGELETALGWAEPWRLKHQENPKVVLPGTLAFAYAYMGDYEDDPRFVELVRSMNLPASVHSIFVSNTCTAFSSCWSPPAASMEGALSTW